MKRAVIYYSLNDNTRKAAEKIAQLLDADLYRIDTEKPMPQKTAEQIMYGGMLASFGLCPKIKGVPGEINQYDELILGTPIWAGKHAAAVNTLLKQEEVCNKVTGVFTLSGSVNNKGCIKRLHKRLKHLCHTASLADRSSELAENNEEKIQQFVKEIISDDKDGV